MKKIDWGMVFPLFGLIVFIALALAVVGREFLKHEMYAYNLSAPISWIAVATHFTIIYFVVVEMFLSIQVVRELAGLEPLDKWF
ncbi:MAG: hypothetical protein AAB695_01715 [Patescibacteria group bacterium]